MVWLAVKGTLLIETIEFLLSLILKIKIAFVTHSAEQGEIWRAMADVENYEFLTTQCCAPICTEHYVQTDLIIDLIL